MNHQAGRAGHLVHGGGLHAALMMTLRNHMDAGRPCHRTLNRAEQTGPLKQLSIALWAVREALEMQERAAKVVYAERLFEELCESRMYSSAHNSTLGRDEACLRPVDENLLENLESAARKLAGVEAASSHSETKKKSATDTDKKTDTGEKNKHLGPRDLKAFTKLSLQVHSRMKRGMNRREALLDYAENDQKKAKRYERQIDRYKELFLRLASKTRREN
jgi:hypothetical protein